MERDPRRLGGGGGGGTGKLCRWFASVDMTDNFIDAHAAWRARTGMVASNFKKQASSRSIARPTIGGPRRCGDRLLN